MPKLIDADALAKRLIELGFYPAVIKRALEEAPDADNTAHAHWIFEHHPRDTGYHFTRIVCSNAG